ncbi:TatD family deoxyribonuclease [Pseudoalteromonas piscicida]|uniref:TatD family deoxyribonuclease n=1 Tax=Pseudoalteromonas piscicida TaxID=43662 RepID=A0AAQ2EYV4_PSEO7|nr:MULTISPECIES: TatD family hydrolase [Pseudoalteromonas]KJY92301.1 hydrolase [Pseudoalteromonas piscicida]TMN36188.1 TatD family deoxyribonuclease [Pseudoalteromonas piscicida]TMN41648.1 TatD family deoxyribonuclease [Pseudoalteromonas piscicida]TMN46559.1 TatD family deoxyribonuclease [Pseudoalteromonas piscicida]TMN55270.1 TatD family deoxyribonuclease [Pseudoalteromonas piscicida]
MAVGKLSGSTHKFAFIDSHCHLDFDELADDLAMHIKAAHCAGVERFVVPGVTLKQSQQLVEFQAHHPQCEIAAGLHPYFIGEHRGDDMTVLVEHVILNRTQLCAIGECGIDTTCDALERQIALFEAHIALSNQVKLPLIVHHRKSHHLIAAAFKRVKPQYGGVIHAFSGSKQQAEYYIAQGFKLGVGGTITYPRGEKTAQVISQLPLESLVLETDAPSMPLHGYQGKPNSPKRVVQVFDRLCEYRSETPSELAAALYRNTTQLFGLG